MKMPFSLAVFRGVAFTPVFLLTVTGNLALGLAAQAGPAYKTDEGNLSQLTSFIGDSNFSNNVFELTARAGLKGAPLVQPWSSTFWPLRMGSTANPYNEGGGGIFKWITGKLRFLKGADAAYDRQQKRQAKILDKIANGKLDSDTIRDLSPAEKYDLFLGDTSFSFTNAEWNSMNEASNLAKQWNSSVQFWEGSCQGWSTAAIYTPRPEHLFSIPSLDGRFMIPFYPDDLKALATRLWANSLIQDQTVSQGTRCILPKGVKRPPLDPATGKVLDEVCEGVNPGDFHMSVLELVGARKRSFVVNRANNAQVWNQPIASYEVEYFNPMSGDKAELSKAIVLASLYSDPYAQYRAVGTKSIVGVRMKLRYVSETEPNHNKDNDASKDLIKTLDVKYDLSLNETNQIIGGEWRTSFTPDESTESDESDEEASTGSVYSDEPANAPKYPGFLWNFKYSEPMALSIKDPVLPDDIFSINQQELIKASQAAANFRYTIWKVGEDGRLTNEVYRKELRPQPLAKVVNMLIGLSRK